LIGIPAGNGGDFYIVKLFYRYVIVAVFYWVL
jgi:hypothetical protein